MVSRRLYKANAPPRAHFQALAEAGDEPRGTGGAAVADRGADPGAELERRALLHKVWEIDLGDREVLCRRAAEDTGVDWDAARSGPL